MYMFCFVHGLTKELHHVLLHINYMLNSLFIWLVYHHVSVVTNCEEAGRYGPLISDLYI